MIELESVIIRYNNNDYNIVALTEKQRFFMNGKAPMAPKYWTKFIADDWVNLGESDCFDKKNREIQNWIQGIKDQTQEISDEFSRKNEELYQELEEFRQSQQNYNKLEEIEIVDLVPENASWRYVKSFGFQLIKSAYYDEIPNINDVNEKNGLPPYTRLEDNGTDFSTIKGRKGLVPFFLCLTSQTGAPEYTDKFATYTKITFLSNAKNPNDPESINLISHLFGGYIINSMFERYNDPQLFERHF